MDSWTAALRVGADGLVLSPWRGEDGVLTLGKRPGRVSRGSLTVALEEFWGHVPDADNLVLDLTQLAEPTSTEVVPVLEKARASGCSGRLWVVGPGANVLADLVAETAGAAEGVSSLHMTDPRSTTRGAEAHAAWLRQSGIDGVMVPEEHTSGGLIALMHRFSRAVVADGADFRRMARRALETGVDGVCGSDPEALHDGYQDALKAGSEA